ncbi:hypothetical protein BC831DRAFT_479986 [Entophlyctis helioformis]|nr:hypothetical protein BC831DRAFT_479986 [Entophlyctis helioformis]
MGSLCGARLLVRHVQWPRCVAHAVSPFTIVVCRENGQCYLSCPNQMFGECSSDRARNSGHYRQLWASIQTFLTMAFEDPALKLGHSSSSSSTDDSIGDIIMTDAQSTKTNDELSSSVHEVCLQGTAVEYTLYVDTASHILKLIDEQYRQLAQIRSSSEWIAAMARICAANVKAVDEVAHVFSYLERSFLHYRLVLSLRETLYGFVRNHLIVPFEDRLFQTLLRVTPHQQHAFKNACIIEYDRLPLQVDHAVLASLLRSLVRIDPDGHTAYACLHPDLMLVHVPLADLPSNMPALQSMYSMRLNELSQVPRVKRPAPCDLHAAAYTHDTFLIPSPTVHQHPHKKRSPAPTAAAARETSTLPASATSTIPP